MKCKICDTYFVLETKFDNLFVFEDTCEKCSLLSETAPKMEVIPVEQGVIKYLYLYDGLTVNYKQKEYLSANFKTLFVELLDNLNNETVLLIDDFVYKELSQELIYIIGFKQIIFVSLFRYEFEYFVMFY